MKYFKKLHKDQLAAAICKSLKLVNKIEVISAVYSPLRPKNHTTDIWVKCKNDNASNIFLYVRMNISDNTNGVLDVEILPKEVQEYAVENNEKYENIHLELR